MDRRRRAARRRGQLVRVLRHQCACDRAGSAGADARRRRDQPSSPPCAGGVGPQREGTGAGRVVAGRSHFDYRIAIAAADRSTLADGLRRAASDTAPRHRVTAAPSVAFLFTGQGSQYRGMGRELYDREPVFRASMDRSDEILRQHMGQSILPIVFEDTTGLIDQTAITQPAIFALEYALFELWASWGVHPSVVMGHSLGEDVAACAAGVFSLEDGLRMIAARGRLMQDLPQGGSMVAVFAGQALVSDAIRGREADVAIAAINGPESIVLSGSTAVLSEIVGQLAAAGVKSRPVTASHAFHSPLMDPILEAFGRV